MIVDLKTISPGPRNYALVFEKDWWGLEEKRDQILGLDAPLHVKLKIFRAGDKFVLEGDVAGGLQVRCDRCLAPYRRDLKFPFRVFISLPLGESEQTEVELAEDDLEVEFVCGENVDLDHVIREQIYLSLPIKSLCKDDCLGICPVCGINSNSRKCGCTREQGHPGFLKLKTLKSQGD